MNMFSSPRRSHCEPTRLAALATALLLIMGCGSSMALYDATAYKQATDLKAEALTLMEKAHETAGDHQDEIDELRLNLRKALEYERGRARNQITTRMWEIMIDPDRNLLGGFLRRWEADDALNPAFVGEASMQVGAAFDEIIALEAKKIDPEDVNTGLFPGL